MQTQPLTSGLERDFPGLRGEWRQREDSNQVRWEFPFQAFDLFKGPDRYGIERIGDFTTKSIEMNLLLNRRVDFLNIREDSPGRKWLKDVIAELELIDDEVAEEMLPEIRSDTKDKARKIIFALMEQPIAPTVYPTMDGEIALYFKSPIATSSVLILVGNDGQAVCFSYIDGKNRRARYEDATELPDEFVRAQLRELADA